MENYTLEYATNHASEILTEIRELITLSNSTLLYLLSIFLICSLLKVFIFKNDKKELKKNIFDIFKLIFPIFILNSITVITTIEYELNVGISNIISHYMIYYFLIIFALYTIIYKVKSYLPIKSTELLTENLEPMNKRDIR